MRLSVYGRDLLSAYDFLRHIDGSSSQTLQAYLTQVHNEGNLRNLIGQSRALPLSLFGGREKIAKLLTQRQDAIPLFIRDSIIRYLATGENLPEDDQLMTSLFLATSGEDLTRLKNSIDRHSPDDLANVVFQVIESEPLREKILAHIQTEAKKVQTQAPLVLSDIDDTIMCNWLDERFPKTAVYPGVRTFYRLLGKWEEDRLERKDPIFISARPEGSFGFVEMSTLMMLQKMGFSSPSILSSPLMGLMASGIASTKYDNFKLIEALYPEYSKVFIGDNGQEDEAFGKLMLEDYCETVRAVFIHDVQGTRVERSLGFSTHRIRTASGDRHIIYFDTYIGAANAAYMLKLLSREDVENVIQNALEDFEGTSFLREKDKIPIRALLKRDAQFLSHLS